MSERKKIAIIGCGCISATHIAAIKDTDVGDIVALCDIRKDRLERAHESVPEAKTYSSFDEIIDEKAADIIHICTPHYLHKPMTIKALETGHDVYLEKPTGMNCDEVSEIISVSKKTGKKVCVSFQNRLINSTAFAKEVLNSGELGNILGVKGLVTWSRGGKYYTESGWRGEWKREGGGVLMNQSIHTLDLLYYFGGEVESVEGSAKLHKNKDTTEVEDTAEAFIRFKSGSTGIFYATNCHVTDSPVEIEIVCEKGSLLLRNDILYKTVGDSINVVTQNEKVGVGKAYWGNGHSRMISNFYSTLNGEEKYYCDISDALPVMMMIESIYKTSGKSIIEK